MWGAQRCPEGPIVLKQIILCGILWLIDGSRFEKTLRRFRNAEFFASPTGCRVSGKEFIKNLLTSTYCTVQV